MALIKKQEFEELAKIESAFCISIFIPTHRSGKETFEKKDRLVFKNELKEVEKELREQGLSEKEAKKMLNPAKELLNDTGFWRHQSDGLAVFLSEEFFRYYTLPVFFEAYHYISNEFYLKPLMPLFVGDGRFFLLSLSLHQVKFYEGYRHSITEVKIDDLAPERLEEVVGYDYRQKFLQFRAHREGHTSATFHGHGEGKDEKKEEVKHFLRAVDKGLMEMLHDESPPMVFAGLDYLFGIYKEINSYSQLQETHIDVNPTDKDLFWLHEKAWELLRPLFEKEELEKKEQYQQHLDTQRASADIKEVIPAALQGRVDTLFVRNRTDEWGLYDPRKNQVELVDEKNGAHVSLLNLAAVQTFLNGGKVFLLEEEDMPSPHSKVNALYRY